MKGFAFCILIAPFSLFSQQAERANKKARPGEKDIVAVAYSGYINAESMSKNLHVLASDEYEGRETGKKGQKMAAAYIADQFKLAGIPPYMENTYYQEFSLNVILPEPAEVFVDRKQYTGNKDYYNYPEQTERSIETDSILFLGYGIQEDGYNDYKNMDVKDKVVMMLAGEPVLKDSSSLITGKKTRSLWSTYAKVKLEKARESGVKVLLMVVDDVAKDLLDNKHRLESPAMKLELNNEGMFIIYISKQMANDILKKEKVETLIQKIADTKKPLHLAVKTNFEINIKNKVQKVGSENVLGYVEGSDLKEELIVITAHYDHLGIDGKIVYNGADDDGSGTVAVIELAKTFAKAKNEGHGPRRSILFMTVAGEEKGLLGSAYYVKNPIYPLENTVCDLNIDMIGRLDIKHENNSNYIYLIGSDKLSSGLHTISENANKMYTNLELDYTFNDAKDKNRFYYRSDHYNFAKNGVPVIFYFNGVHADYHKETDEVEKIDFKKMETITRLVFFTTWELANRTERIKVDSNKK
ncbi:MAG: M28 family peptidase [Bacteroidota bacterium]